MELRGNWSGVPAAMVRILVLAVAVSGLAACGKQRHINEIVATREASSAELDTMKENAAKLKGKDGLTAETPMSVGPFLVKFKSGTHKVIWTLEGQQAQAGPVDATIVATLGDSSGGRVLACRTPGSKQVPAGAARVECESAPFRVEQDKTFILQTGLSRAQGFDPTRLTATVASVPVQVGWGGWFTAMIYAMVGAVMLVVWYIFFKR
jgi:hypothetical protein